MKAARHERARLVVDDVAHAVPSQLMSKARQATAGLA